MTDWKPLLSGVTTHAPEATMDWAAALAGEIPADSVLALQGDLGAGKTTFVKGLARAWGITQAITSPTFNLFNVYHGERQLLHLDAYRLDGAESLDSLMLEDFLESPWCLAVEWPENLGRESEWLAACWWLRLSVEARDGGHDLVLRAPPG